MHPDSLFNMFGNKAHLGGQEKWFSSPKKQDTGPGKDSLPFAMAVCLGKDRKQLQQCCRYLPGGVVRSDTVLKQVRDLCDF